MRSRSPAAKARRKAKNEAARREFEAQCAVLKARGSFCANCAHCSPYPGPGAGDKIICDLDTDYYGYGVTKPDRVCTRWKQKAAV